MKKEYKKPELLFDSFELSTSIAAGCANKVDTFARGSCGIAYGPVVLFLKSMTAVCTMGIEDGDGYCYHNPDDTRNMFSSN